MLTVTFLDGQCEPLTGFKGFKRTRKVNGEKQISFTLFHTEGNQYAYPLVLEESIIEFDGEEYVIKQLSEKNIGNTTYKEVTAVHKFFNDMLNDRIYTTITGTKTFSEALNFVFDGSSYTVNIIDLFGSQTFDNFGNDNRLSLFQKLLEAYKAEFKIVGNSIYLYEQIGNDTDFQFRYNFNIKTIERKVDTSGLSTYIKGTGQKDDNGNPLITAEYTSPNANIFGILHANPVDDERYTDYDSLLQRIKDDLQDTPNVSITIDFIDLRSAGYPYIVPNEGDRVFLIYEPMDDLNIETRIMEIDETFNDNLEPIQTNITLANYKSDFAGTLFATVDKAMSKIVGDNGKIKYSVLDDAVKQATEALKSAQTELVFENGIIAIEKTDPNKLVLFNSAGIGISSDAGNTFKTAMTGDGIVADVITAGTLRGINITGVTMDLGNGKFVVDENGNVKFAGELNGATGTFSGSVSTLEDVTVGNNLYIGTADYDTVNSNWIRFRNSEAGIYSDYNGSEDYHLGISSRQVTIDTPFGITTFDSNVSFHNDIYMNNYNLNDVYTLNAYTLNAYYISSTGSITTAGNMYVGSDGSFKSNGGYVVLAASSGNVYLQSDYGVRVTAPSDVSTFMPVYASDFVTSSLVELKQDIELWNGSALSIINSADIYQYRLKTDVANGKDKLRHGFIIGDGYKTPIEFMNYNHDGIVQYEMNSLNTKAIQELSQQNQDLILKIADLENRLSVLEAA